MRPFIGSVLGRIDQRWPTGLYRGLLFPFLDFSRKWLTPYGYFRRLVRWLMEIEDEEKMPPFAAEMYQVIWLLTLTIMILISPSQIAAWVGLLRVYDLALFALYWILVSDDRLHFYQRSLAGFMVNLVEIVALFAVAFMAWGCVGPPVMKWKAVYNSVRTVVTVGPSTSFEEATLCCSALVALELVLAYTLSVIVVAGLAGKMLRTEVNKP